MSSNQSLYIQRGHETDVIEKRDSFKVDVIIISLVAIVVLAQQRRDMRHNASFSQVWIPLRRYDRLCVNL